MSKTLQQTISKSTAQPISSPKPIKKIFNATSARSATGKKVIPVGDSTTII